MKKIFIGMSSLAMMTCLFVSTACQNNKPLTEKVKLDVTCVDCTINGETKFHNTYALHDNVTLIAKANENYHLPDDIDAKIGDKQLVEGTDYTYSKFSGEIKIAIEGDTTITITAQEGSAKEDLNKYSWEQISQISESGEASKLFELGATKDIVVNGQTQKVRIIGFDQDVDSGGNKIGITFEFVNILSDENGHSLAAYWNDVSDCEGSNYNYMDSTIRAVLNGNDYEGSSTKDMKWFQYFGTDHDEDTNKAFSDSYSGKSVLNDMLPEDLKSVLKAPSKLVYTKSAGSSLWAETTVNDKLFLLSPREIGETDEQLKDPSTFTYDFYDTYYVAALRKKQQITLSDARETALECINLEGEFTCDESGDFPIKICMAGVNEDDAGQYWLRSPNRESGYGSTCACIVNNWGLVGPQASTFTGYEVFLCANGLAPAFCI